MYIIYTYIYIWYIGVYIYIYTFMLPLKKKLPPNSMYIYICIYNPATCQGKRSQLFSCRVPRGAPLPLRLSPLATLLSPCHSFLTGEKSTNPTERSLYYQPKQCTIIFGKSLKITINLHCLIHPKMGNLMTPATTHLEKAEEGSPCH